MGSFTEKIKEKAYHLGFSACGIAPVGTANTESSFFNRWLSNGFHADMEYMENYKDIRLNPEKLLDGAKSVISVALNYYPKQKRDTGLPYIAYYAYGKDYHKIIKKKLQALWQEIIIIIGEDNHSARYFTDSAPILERYWAWKCGLGWIGKNTNLIIPKKGSFFFLGEIVTTWEADVYDSPQKNRCGTCSRCIEACPTKALRSPKCLDARRCISYQTIENRGKIPDEIAKQLGNRLYGCDTCQIVCPWNRFSSGTEEQAFSPTEEFITFGKENINDLSRERYNRIFAHSAVKRVKYEGLLRNIHHLNSKNHEK